MKELIEALETEQRNAEEYSDRCKAKGYDLLANYWEGYKDAMTNAAALIYGPTPLDETERN